MTQQHAAAPSLHLHFPGAADGPLCAALHAIQARAVQAGDLPFLQSLYADTRSQEMQAVGWSGELRDRFLADQFRLQHQHYQANFPQAQFLLLLRAGLPVGRLYWQCGPLAARATLIDICLLRPLRGAGIGTGVLGLLTAQADALGKAIHLHVDRFNPARRWYARLGFLEVGGGVLPDDAQGFHVPMARPIGRIAAKAPPCERAAH